MGLETKWTHMPYQSFATSNHIMSKIIFYNLFLPNGELRRWWRLRKAKEGNFSLPFKPHCSPISPKRREPSKISINFPLQWVSHFSTFLNLVFVILIMHDAKFNTFSHYPRMREAQTCNHWFNEHLNLCYYEPIWPFLTNHFVLTILTLSSISIMTSTPTKPSMWESVVRGSVS